MKLKLLFITARNAVIEIEDGGIYYTKEAYQIYANDQRLFATNKVITTIPDLKPDKQYHIQVKDAHGNSYELLVHTSYEYVTLNVKEFGAKGDGKHNDTLYIQAAIMACPLEGRVLIPEGNYLVTSLFLKSNLVIEIAEGSSIQAHIERERYPILPGLVESYDEAGEYNLGTWEGNPLPMFSGILTGIDVHNVIIYGKGTIDGRAQRSDWWVNEKVMRGAFRPRLLFLSHCSVITIQGIHFKNSPSWNIHPYFCKNLNFLDIDIENPQNSPNTDGLNPESCSDVTIAGVHFSLGDDCIALKSGKIYMGKKYRVVCENIHIRQCFMENGHGAITIGSEMAAGVKNITVRDCIFQSTDRGLRVKTRRGRGKDAVIDQITFDRIIMNHVMTPFVVNCFYYCDPDGRTKYVQSKEEYPVDDRTPFIKTLTFTNITCNHCHVAAAFFYGLPEQKIERIIMENIKITYAENAKCDYPAMMSGIEPCSKKGLFAANIKELVLNNIVIEGQVGEKLIVQQVNHIIKIRV